MEEKIKDIIGEIIDNPDFAKTLSNDADILNDVALDSLQIIAFILRVEEELEVEFDFERFDYSHLTSIETFCRFISALQRSVHTS